MDRAGAPSSSGLRRQFVGGGARALLAALDHLLEQNEWARQRLAMHAGRKLLIGIDGPALPGLPEPRLLAVVGEGGRLKHAHADDGMPPAVTMLLRPSIDAVFDFFRGGSRALSRHLRMEGDVMLAGTLGEIVRHLRWDATEDLSRFTGDIAAERIARTAASAASAVGDMGKRLESSAARYLSVESGRLVDRSSLELLSLEIDALEQRISVLQSTRSS
jgi:ubiquinone biosynthesis protein UbiJ